MKNDLSSNDHIPSRVKLHHDLDNADNTNSDKTTGNTNTTSTTSSNNTSTSDNPGCGCGGFWIFFILILFITGAFKGCSHTISNHFSRYPMPSSVSTDYKNGEALRHVIYHNFQKNEPNITVEKITVSRTGNIHIYTNVHTMDQYKLHHIWSEVCNTDQVPDDGTAYFYGAHDYLLFSSDPSSSDPSGMDFN